MTETVRIADRYQGFPGLAIGGYTGGLLARHLGTEAEVGFRRPIPTDTPLDLVKTDDAIELRLAGDVAAEATTTTVDTELPDPVPMEDATAASRDYPGHRHHPYPSCFTCGPERAAGDGLRVFPGPVSNGSMVAAAWTPHPDLAEGDGVLPREFVWSAVDCSTIWPLIEAAPPDSQDHVVSGRLAVRLDGQIRAGEPYVVSAWPLPPRGNKRPAAAVITDAAGRVQAVAEHTLVVTDWGIPLGVNHWDSEPEFDEP